jgi:hypothetical protein
MSNFRVVPAAPRQRRFGGRRRWSAAEKAAHLAAFARSAWTADQFCRARDIPRSTFALWQREARGAPARRAARSRFAAVDVVARPVATAPGAGMVFRVRSPAGVDAELAGLDRATAVALLRVVLHPDGAELG